MEKTVLGVAQYLDVVNNALRQIDSSAVLVEGEVCDYRVSQGKWVTFDLKDEKEAALLKCFGTTWQITVPLVDGARVRVSGQPKVYEAYGRFSLNLQSVELVGEGALKAAYEALKKRLAQEGLFESGRKRRLPRFANRIGLITSTGAAAYGDFIRVMNNRWGGVEVDCFPVHVQGALAVPEILSAFSYFNRLPVEDRPDALALVRGGGALEELHAFNDEQVARAVFASKIPVVVGVGHERDESLCDFVADVRASTPSNAAERLVPSRDEIRFEIESMRRHVTDTFESAVTSRTTVLAHAARAMTLALTRERERHTRAQESLLVAAQAWLSPLRERVDTTTRLLTSLDPRRVLKRGYAIVRIGNRLVRDSIDLAIGGEVAVQLGAGSFDAEVLRLNGKGKQKLV